MKRLILMLAAAICVSPAFAENSTTPAYEYLSNETDFGLLREFSGHREFFPTDLIQEVEIFIPKSVNANRRKEVLDLWNKLLDICPECVNGGTIGGSTIVGGNISCPEAQTKPLFGSARDAVTETVTISKTEYDRLVARDRKLAKLEAFSQ